MSCGDLLLICFAGAQERGNQLSHDLLSRWPNANPPELTTWSADQLWSEANPNDHPQVAWLIGADDTPILEVHRALEAVSAWHVPVILTRGGDDDAVGTGFQGGVVTARPDGDPDQIRVLIQSTLAHAEICQQLNSELRITQIHHGGLQGQMDKLDEEMRLAARVQREFLPTSLPKIGDVEVEVMFKPASYVSGDIYDAQRLDENHIGFWIADVVGHGVPAALMTMFVKRALPTKRILKGGYQLVPPAEALAQLNDEMVNREGGGIRFATGVYGLINCKTFELQMARAGHPLPMLLRASGETEMLEPEGPLLGVFESDDFEQRTYQLYPGDRLLIYSDGYEVAFGDKPCPVDPEYLREFQKLREGTLDQAVHRLEKNIMAQPGSLHQEDDLTLMMVGINETAKLPEGITQPQPVEASA